MYKVTLSMPIYNVAPYVERALLSALNQTFESIEFLLVDDRGTDNSMEIVRRIIKDHPRGKDVRIIEHPHNIGTGATKNIAINNAQGEYLFFMDSDDEITSDCIQVLYDSMMEEKVDLVVGSYKILNENDLINKEFKFNNILLKGDSCLLYYHYMKKESFPVFTWNKLYSVKFIRENNIKCIPYHNCEDLFFTFNIEIKSKKCHMIDHCTYYYYLREGSFMDSFNKKINTKVLQCLIEVISFQIEYASSLSDKILSDSIIRATFRYVRAWSYAILDSSAMTNEDKCIYILKLHEGLSMKMITLKDKNDFLVLLHCLVSSFSKKNSYYLILFFKYLKNMRHFFR